MNNRTFHDYMLGTAQIGVGLGIISLLARWITGNTILSSPEAMVKYGLYGCIGYALMGSISLMAFSIIGKRIKEVLPLGQTLGDYLKIKLNPLGYWIMIIILLVTSIDTLFMQGMAAAVLLHFLFHLPVSVGLLIFFIFCILYAGIGGIGVIHQFAVFQIIILFAAAILIPVYFFVQEGIQPVYDGIRLYHPYMLFIKQYDGLLFISAGLLVGFGQVFADLATWQRIFMIEKKKVFLTFLLSGIIWSVFPLAFSSLFMIVIFTGGFNDITSILSSLANKITSPFFLLLFIVSAFSAITSTFGTCLHSLVSLIVQNIILPFRPKTKEKEKLKFAYLLSIVIGAILFAISLYFTPSVFELLFFFGNIYAALIAPFLFIVLCKGKIDTMIPIYIILGFCSGYAAQFFLDDMVSIWISAVVSFGLLLIHVGIKLATNFIGFAHK